MTDGMAEGLARVVSVADGTAWLEAERRPSCGGCAAAAGCGTASLSKIMGRRTVRFAIPDDFAAVPGEWVVVAVSERALTRAALVAYMVPLVGLIAMAVLGGGLGLGDIWVAGLAGLGLAGGLLAARRLGAVAVAPSFLRRDRPAACPPDAGT